MPKRENVHDVIESRKSIRAFLDRPVERITLERLLQLAGRAPSGANMQPWQVVVITGEPLRVLGKQLYDLSLSGVEVEREYNYYPQHWREPYLARRRKVGWDLYRSLGIAKTDRSEIARQQAKNFRFFDAPVGLIFTMDRDMEIGSWLDLGMFIQTLALAARAEGLDTCIQAAFSEYHQQVAETLQIDSHRQVICGMAMGYRDESAPENNFATERMDIAQFVRFIG